tara:strand:+ start:710 stop:1648 length:939 start_codon:yes stop_codon:yes gene_type:complete
MSILNVDIIASQSTGDVTVNDPLKVDLIQNSSGAYYNSVNVNGVPLIGDETAGFIRVGQSSNNNLNLTHSVCIGSNMNQASGVNWGGGIAIGNSCLNQAKDLSSNIAIGYGCMGTTQNASITDCAKSNIAIGISAGSNLTGVGPSGDDGSFNVILGRFAGTTLTSGSNNIVIGNSANTATATASDTITLGNNQIFALRCNVQTITSLSDARDKKEVTELPIGLDFINGLKPVTFVWDERGEDGKKDIKDFGFIAQDLKKSQEDAKLAETLKLVYEENPEKLEASYGKLIPILVKAIQEMSSEIKLLKEELLN